MNWIALIVKVRLFLDIVNYLNFKRLKYIILRNLKKTYNYCRNISTIIKKYSCYTRKIRGCFSIIYLSRVIKRMFLLLAFTLNRSSILCPTIQMILLSLSITHVFSFSVRDNFRSIKKRLSFFFLLIPRG